MERMRLDEDRLPLVLVISDTAIQAPSASDHIVRKMLLSDDFIFVALTRATIKEPHDKTYLDVGKNPTRFDQRTPYAKWTISRHISTF
jgi:hypothetical protein